MIYQGDTTTFVLSLMKSDGSAPTIGVAPSIQIINLANDSAVLGSPANMSLISGSSTLYKYRWSVSSTLVTGDYLAVVSYVADSVTFTGKSLEKVRVGDSRITDIAAKDLTVAKDATVAKDFTVAHQSDLATISPNTSSVILAIKAKTDNLPSDPASTTTLTSISSLVTDVHDATLGSIVINKSVNPITMTLKKIDTTTLASFTLSDSDTTTTKQRQ